MISGYSLKKELELLKSNTDAYRRGVGCHIDAITKRLAYIKNNLPNDTFHKLMTGELKLSDL